MKHLTADAIATSGPFVFLQVRPLQSVISMYSNTACSGFYLYTYMHSSLGSAYVYMSNSLWLYYNVVIFTKGIFDYTCLHHDIEMHYRSSEIIRLKKVH